MPDNNNEETKPTIPLIMDSVTSVPWAILPAKLDEIMGVLHSKNNNELVAKAIAQSEESVPDKKGYSIENGIATIPIYGILAKRFNIIMAWSGGTSYQILEKSITTALSDNSVKAILLDVDSPGGNVDGMVDVANVVYNARNGEKPIMTFADGLMASAAYYIGSASDYVVASNSTTMVGSIGVISSPHFDLSKRYEKENIKVTTFFSGKFKFTPNEFTPLSKDHKKYVQDRLDYLYSLFINAVAKHRSSTVAIVNRDMAEGRIFLGEQAINAGMADSIMTRERAIEHLKEMTL